MISIFGSERINYYRLSTSRPCSVASSIQFSMGGLCVLFSCLSLGGGGGFVNSNESQAFLTQLDLSSVIDLVFCFFSGGGGGEGGLS
jgi:hypothetical protein